MGVVEEGIADTEVAASGTAVGEIEIAVVVMDEEAWPEQLGGCRWVGWAHMRIHSEADWGWDDAEWVPNSSLLVERYCEIQALSPFQVEGWGAGAGRGHWAWVVMRRLGGVEYAGKSCDVADVVACPDAAVVATSLPSYVNLLHPHRLRHHRRRRHLCS